MITTQDKELLAKKGITEEQIAEQLDTIVFSSKIRNGVAVAEAPAHGESLLKYAPKSNPCLDYMEFIAEIIRLTNPSDSF